MRHYLFFGLAVFLATGILLIILSAMTFRSAEPDPAVPLVFVGPEEPLATTTGPAILSQPNSLSTTPLIPTSISFDVATVTAVSADIFTYAHGTVAADGRFFIGMEDRVGNVHTKSQMTVFIDPADLSKYMLVTMPKQGSIDTMVYDEYTDKIYLAISGNADLELFSFDPRTFAVNQLLSTTSIDSGRRPAIVSDGSYIYGITNTDPSVVFKLSLADKSLVYSRGHIANGHSATIAYVNGEEDIFFGGGMSNGFEKVRASDLASLGKVVFAPCQMSDDSAYANGYIFVGCESVPYGYRIDTSDLRAQKFTLPGESLGIFALNSQVYNVSRDGYLDMFADSSMRSLTRYKITDTLVKVDTKGLNLEINELLYSPLTNNLYFTAWWGIPGLYRLSIPVSTSTQSTL